MTQITKMTPGQLMDVRDATQAKLDSLKARKPSKNADVEDAFAKVEDALKNLIAEYNAEMARRA